MKKLNRLNYFFYSVVSLLVPAFIYAFSLNSAGTNFKSVIEEILGIINLLLPILSALALIVFFWGLSKFILSANNAIEIQKGKDYMMWGILALFILLTFKTIIVLASNDLFDSPITPDQNNLLLPIQ